MSKKYWKKPIFEEIELKFDKEMGNACLVSGGTPHNKVTCGIRDCVQSSCFNKNSGCKPTADKIY